jgi:hypothetical protein
LGEVGPGRRVATFCVVWWVNAEQTAPIVDQFAVLAAELGLPAVVDPAEVLRGRIGSCGVGTAGC